MSKLSKVSQTKEAKATYQHPIIDILLERRSKEELKNILHCNERDAREIVAMAAMHYAVITHSSKGAGYRRARPIESLSLEELKLEDEEVLRSIKEINSRIKCLKKRLKPLIAYHKVAQNKLNNGS